MPRLYTHTIVDTLPSNAVKVSDYAKSKGFTYPYVYELARKVRDGKIEPRKAGFNMVTFQNINFVIPLTKD